MAVELRFSDKPAGRPLAPRRGLLFKTLVAGLVLLGPVLNGLAEEPGRAAQELVAAYKVKLSELAEWCDRRELTAQVEETRAWPRPRDPNKTYVSVLPRRVGRPALPTDAPADLVEWDTRFARLRRDQSNSLFELARQSICRHRASLAFELVLAALGENPDNEPVRRLLGYQKFRGEWHTLYEVRKLRSGQVHDERFGWLPKSYVRRYGQGQRRSGNRWINAEEDARLHHGINSGWDVESEHYTIRTNAGIEAGVELGTKLERLYRVWKQLFVRFYASEAQLIALFDGRTRGRPVKLPRYKVVYFRDREDYNRSLRASMPGIAISIGVYVESTRRAYFFAGKDSDRRTLNHEATHQLFHESRPVAPNVGAKANFWIVEGIAMYMESLREEDGCYVLGGFDDLRMQAARFRLLKDDFYVPLEEFTGYGMEKIQSDPRIATLYSQAAGLTHFLIYFDAGRYRDALVAYLSAVYNGCADPAALSALTGVTYANLDKQYRRIMETAGGTQPKSRAKRKRDQV